MIPRALETTLAGALRTFPVAALIGSRQVGKTTLARSVAESAKGRTLYLDLEKPSDLDKLANPELYLMQHPNTLIILDEIQRLPEVFPLLRHLVDDTHYGSRFLILGSASPDLLRQSSESLAGRIRYIELTPFLLSELGHDVRKGDVLWLRGGYPRSFLQPNDTLSSEWRTAFIATYLERDLPQLGVQVPAAQLRRFWEMLAHWQGQIWNASKFAANFNVSAPTIRRYLDILTDTFLVRQLQPYHGNLTKRLVKSPKIYIRDTGLLHSLLRILDAGTLFAHPHVGISWESFVVEQILNMMPQQIGSYFYRTHAGAELDLVLDMPGQQRIGLDVKFGHTARVSKGFRQALDDVRAQKGYLLTRGDEAYPLDKNVSAVPYQIFLETTLPELLARS